MTVTPDRLVGVWRLAAFIDVDDAGAEHDGPLGPNPDGFLIYTPEGHVSVSMMRSGPGPAPAFMGYAGLWRVIADRVVHRIVVSSRADWVGVDQSREAELADNRLTIRATREVDGRAQRRMLHWRRVSGS